MSRSRSASHVLILLVLPVALLLEGCGDSTSSVTSDPDKLKAAIAKKRADAGEPAKGKSGSARKGG